MISLFVLAYKSGMRFTHCMPSYVDIESQLKLEMTFVQKDPVSRERCILCGLKFWNISTPRLLWILNLKRNSNEIFSIFEFQISSLLSLTLGPQSDHVVLNC